MRSSTAPAAALLLALFCLATAAVAADPHGDHATAHHSFEDVEHWQAVFDDPQRDTWQKPREVVGALALKPGMSVADIGAGTGYFLPHLSAALAPHGVVYAAEPEPALLAHIRQRIADEKLQGVVPVLASAADPHLPDERIDLVLIVNTYHHIDDRLAYLAKLRSYLKPLGRIAVIDWKEGELPVGPPPEHRVARNRVLAEMRESGFAVQDSPDLLPHQYFLLFRKAEAATVGGR